MLKIICMIITLGFGCKSPPPKATKLPMFTLNAATASGNCTYTVDADNNIILGAGCTAADIFVDAANNDFHLVAGAPAIGNAVCLPEVPVDFDGNPRPTPGRPPGQGCDIGAFQFIGASLPPLPPTGLTITGVQP
jgi:hypothetical protein